MVDIEAYLQESNAIEGVYDESALDASVEAWEYISQQEDLTHDVVKTGHRILLEDRQPNIAGTYREIQVYIGDSVPPPPVVVKSEMERLLNWKPLDPLEAIEWHVAFEQIHPFQDGNGRVGRLLYLWHCESLGVEPIIWRESDRHGYYELFGSTVDVGENSATDHNSNSGHYSIDSSSTTKVPSVPTSRLAMPGAPGLYR
ncbi:Fic family protein [Natrialbaceae archaeon A-CW1-1]